MKSLSVLKDEGVCRDLRCLAEFILVAGVSSEFPKDDEGRVSLPFALGIICGAQPHHASDDFDFLLGVIPGVSRYRFANCWDVIEAEVGEDILVWSQSVDVDKVTATLLSIADDIELS